MSNRFIIRRLKPRFNAELNAIVCPVLQDVVEVDVLRWDGSGCTSLDLDESYRSRASLERVEDCRLPAGSRFEIANPSGGRPQV
jgi:hypothetical protein